jgi:hypothetical protein
MEDAVLKTVARLDGTPFPSTAALAVGWLRGRRPLGRRSLGPERGHARIETAYCAEVLARTYTAMSLLQDDRPPQWYDPGRFWSGDDLPLRGGFRLGDEVAVDVPAAQV